MAQVGFTLQTCCSHITSSQHASCTYCWQITQSKQPTCSTLLSFSPILHGSFCFIFSFKLPITQEDDVNINFLVWSHITYCRVMALMLPDFQNTKYFFQYQIFYIQHTSTITHTHLFSISTFKLFSIGFFVNSVPFSFFLLLSHKI